MEILRQRIGNLFYGLKIARSDNKRLRRHLAESENEVRRLNALLFDF